MLTILEKQEDRIRLLETQLEALHFLEEQTYLRLCHKYNLPISVYKVWYAMAHNQGKKYEAIADSLHISIVTFRNHWNTLKRHVDLTRWDTIALLWWDEYNEVRREYGYVNITA